MFRTGPNVSPSQGPSRRKEDVSSLYPSIPEEPRSLSDRHPGAGSSSNIGAASPWNPIRWFFQPKEYTNSANEDSSTAYPSPVSSPIRSTPLANWQRPTLSNLDIPRTPLPKMAHSTSVSTPPSRVPGGALANRSAMPTTVDRMENLVKVEVDETKAFSSSFPNGQLPTPTRTPIRQRPPLTTQANTGKSSSRPRHDKDLKPESTLSDVDSFTKPSTARSTKINKACPSQNAISGRIPKPKNEPSQDIDLEVLARAINKRYALVPKVEDVEPSQDIDVNALASAINKRSNPASFLGNVSRKVEDNKEESLASKRSKGPPLLRASRVDVGQFSTGQRLKPYQKDDLLRLLRRERGEKVCGTDLRNNVGYLVGYNMGHAQRLILWTRKAVVDVLSSYGKTPLSLALIRNNIAPADFKGAKATLVLCPSQGLMINWRDERKKFTPELRVCFYDSSSCSLDVNADIVLMTYHQLKYQHQCLTEPTENCDGRVFKELWWRVIGDEFHNNRNPDTKGAAAVLALQKVHGVCLTGTPVQNSWRDFYIVIAFLGLDWHRLNELEIFDRLIYSYMKIRKDEKRPLKHPLLDTVMESFVIRRSAVDPHTGKALVKLPERTDTIIEIVLGPEESAIYDLVKDYSQSIFAQLIRRRQACDHPMLLTKVLEKMPSKGDNDDIKDQMECEDGYAVDFDDPASELSDRDRDPLNALQWPDDLQHCTKADFVSAKLAALKEILESLLPGQKASVFTSFVAIIPALLSLLSSLNIKAVQYTGDMSVTSRHSALKQIYTDDECTVIIISLMAGGTGLNITACDTVIMLEPWWNPYAEEQAIARSHRIGQTRPVHVYHLVTKDTVEESIMETQDSKREGLSEYYGRLSEYYGPCAPPSPADYAVWLSRS